MTESEVRLGHVIAVDGWKMTGVLRPAANGEEAAGSAADIVRKLHVGRLVKVQADHASVFAIVSRLWIEGVSRSPEEADNLVELDALGEIVRGGSGDGAFQRGVSAMPGLGSEILPATPADLVALYALPEVATVAVGTLHQDPSQSAFVAIDSLLGRHFAVLGTTGAGKSCAVVCILRAVLDHYANGHIILLDPHNEYGRAFGERAEVLSPTRLHLPYWLMNFEETAATFVSGDPTTREHETAILKEAVLDARRRYARTKGKAQPVRPNNQPGATEFFHISVDTPVPYYITDVLEAVDKGLGRLEKPAGTIPYLRLKARIEALRADTRFAFMFGGDAVEDVMADILGRILRIPVDGRPVTIIDLSGVPSEIIDVVVSLMCRMIFDFALWSARPHDVPLLIVCEEAHRYVPRDESLGFGPTRRVISRIAREGRKYGVSLCLVSHRPSELSATMLSQCNTIIALRMSNEQDQAFVRGSLPEALGGLVSALPALRTQEAIVLGEGVPVPMRLRFRDLDPAHRPRSDTAVFSWAWQKDHAKRGLIADTIDRWRHQRRSLES